MKPFVKIPFLRISLPLTAGIILQLAFDVTAPAWYWLLCPALLVIGLAAQPISTKTVKYLLLGFSDMFLFLLGLCLTWHTTTSNLPDYYGNLVSTDSTVNCVAVVNDIPVEKEKSVKYELKIKAVKADKKFKSCRGTIIAYFRKDSALKKPKAGEVIFLRARFLAVPPPANPYQFNYKAYLYNKQIYHTAFVGRNDFAVLKNIKGLNPLLDFGLKAKEYLIENLRNSSLDAISFGICSALLTGYDAEVEKPVMDAFSHSGTLHVLSVSGLHTGLIYLALDFLFGLIDRRKRFKTTRFVLITILLWLFALVTGFSAPVLRAVIMFNLFGLGRLYFRSDHRNQLNILMVSAFVLLLYDPFLITDVGFILSYTALAGIIYFQPRIAEIWKPGNFVARHCWQSICASLAATIGTLPVTLFYFKQFPIWFFVANLIVVPLTFVLLFMALLIVLRMNFLSALTNMLVKFMLAFMSIFNSDRVGYIDGIDFTLADAIFLTLIVFLVPIALQTRRYKAVALVFVILISWQLVGICLSCSAKTQSLLTVYSIKNHPTISVKNKRTVSINQIDTLSFNYNVKPHIISFNNAAVNIQRYNFVSAGGNTILLLDKPGYWPACDPASVSTLVLSNNFRLKEKELERFTKLKTIVADHSNNGYILKKAEELSRKFGLDFYNIKLSGAYLRPL